jgi:tetratricopeptide (TPR) repeat protein
MAEIFLLAGSRSSSNTHVIFLHGLGGHPRSTWQTTRDEAALWPRWLAEDIGGLAVWSIGYDAPISRWSGRAMHLADRAENILGRLLTCPELREGIVILIGHSFRGLVIKQLMRTLEIEAKTRTAAASLLDRVRKVAFLATPHTGADKTIWSDRLKIIVKPSAATMCLLRNDPNLRELNRWYRGWAHDRKIFQLVLTETRPLPIFGIVVTQDSADPGLYDARAWPTDTDHFSIAKPSGRDHEVFAYIKDFILEPFERPSSEISVKIAKIVETQGEIKSDTDHIISLLEHGQPAQRTFVDNVQSISIEHLTSIVKAATDPVERLSAAQIETIAGLERQLGATKEQVLGFFRIIGEANIQAEAIGVRLHDIAHRYRALIEHAPAVLGDDSEMARLKAELKGALEEPNLERADAVLAELLAVLDLDVKRRASQAGATCAQRGELAMTRLRYYEATAHFAAAASRVAQGHETEHIKYLFRQEDALYMQGNEFGDNAALQAAAEICNNLLTLCPRDRAPYDWAKAQNNLGNAYGTLGQRDGNQMRLEAAVTAYRAAMQVMTREWCRWTGRRRRTTWATFLDFLDIKEVNKPDWRKQSPPFMRR